MHHPIIGSIGIGIGIDIGNRHEQQQQQNAETPQDKYKCPLPCKTSRPTPTKIVLLRYYCATISRPCKTSTPAPTRNILQLYYRTAISRQLFPRHCIQAYRHAHLPKYRHTCILVKSRNGSSSSTHARAALASSANVWTGPNARRNHPSNHTVLHPRIHSYGMLQLRVDGIALLRYGTVRYHARTWTTVRYRTVLVALVFVSQSILAVRQLHTVVQPCGALWSRSHRHDTEIPSCVSVSCRVVCRIYTANRVHGKVECNAMLV
mmetsp:Transcript_6753/g.14376  ORF Transcript_6753/g.14376 Transcript_6753/m.14376 type:complete len:263 (-) Transcript_6753:110-898(-)